MIRSRLSVLMAEKGVRDSHKITYEKISAKTGLSRGTLVRLNADSLDKGRVEFETLDKLCTYFGCTVGDLLEYVSG